MRVLATQALLGVSLAASLGATPARRQAPSQPASLPAPKLDQPNGLALDAAGNLYISDIGTHQVLKLERGGTLTRIAGTGAAGYNGDGIPALRARLNAPMDLAFDAAGNLLIADTYNHRVRRVDHQGRISTLAGNGRDDYSGDGGPAAKAALNNPQGIAPGPEGNLFIADTFNHVVRRVDAQGIIHPFAGTEAGLSGDGGPAVRAQISLPVAVAVAPDGSVYLSDSGNNRVRRVTPAGIIETVAGNGPGTGTAGAGFAGDGGPAGKAKLFAPADLELGPRGELFLSDTGNHRLRRISEGVIQTMAGTGAAGLSGEGGSPLAAAFASPQKLALGADGALYVADRASHRVLRVLPQGRLETVVGGNSIGGR